MYQATLNVGFLVGSIAIGYLADRWVLRSTDWLKPPDLLSLVHKSYIRQIQLRFLTPSYLFVPSSGLAGKWASWCPTCWTGSRESWWPWLQTTCPFWFSGRCTGSEWKEAGWQDTCWVRTTFNLGTQTKKFKKRFLPFYFCDVWNLLPSQSQSSWVWSTDAPSESFTRCSSASASSSSLCSPTTSPTGAGCRSSSPSHTSSSCPTTGEKHWLHFDFRLSNILLPERILKKQNQYSYAINGLQDKLIDTRAYIHTESLFIWLSTLITSPESAVNKWHLMRYNHIRWYKNHIYIIMLLICILTGSGVII